MSSSLYLMLMRRADASCFTVILSHMCMLLVFSVSFTFCPASYEVQSFSHEMANVCISLFYLHRFGKCNSTQAQESSMQMISLTPAQL